VKSEDPRFEAEGSVPDTSKEKIDLLPAVLMSPTYFISPFRVFRAFRGKREHTSVRDDLVHLMDIDANGWFFWFCSRCGWVKTKVSPINDS
jgi:hypothetical protein